MYGIQNNKKGGSYVLDETCYEEIPLVASIVLFFKALPPFQIIIEKGH
jgi:hypothetical protein